MSEKRAFQRPYWHDDDCPCYLCTVDVAGRTPGLTCDNARPERGSYAVAYAEATP